MRPTNRPPVGLLVLPRVTTTGVDPVYVHIGDNSKPVARMVWKGNGNPVLLKGSELPQEWFLANQKSLFDSFTPISNPEGLYLIQNWSVGDNNETGCVVFVRNWQGSLKHGSYQVLNNVLQIVRNGKNCVEGVLVPFPLGHVVSEQLLAAAS